MLVNLKVSGLPISATIPNIKEINSAFAAIDIKDQIAILERKLALKDQKKAREHAETGIATQMVYNSIQRVRVVHFDVVANSFFVQFLADDTLRENLQTTIQSYDDKIKLKSDPKRKSDYLIKMGNDELYRGKVVGLIKGEKRGVQFLDSGVLEVVEKGQVFELPQELNVEIEPPYAKEFRFYGIGWNISNYLDKELAKFYFDYLAKDRILQLSVETTHCKLIRLFCFTKFLLCNYFLF